MPPLEPWEREDERREGRILSPSGSSKSRPVAIAGGGVTDATRDIEAGAHPRYGAALEVLPGFTDDEDEDDDLF